MAWPAIIGAVGTLAGAGLMAGSQANANSANIGFSEQMYDKQRYWDARAVQIRADDMRAAGLNPVLAAGNAANTTPPTVPKIEPLIKDNHVGKAVGAAIDSMMAKEQLASIREQTELLKTQQEQVKANTWNAQIDGLLKTEEAQFANDYYRGRAGLPAASAAALNARASLTNHDLELLRKEGLPSMVAGSNMGPGGAPAYMVVRGAREATEYLDDTSDGKTGLKGSVRRMRDHLEQTPGGNGAVADLYAQDWFNALGPNIQERLIDTPLKDWPEYYRNRYEETVGKLSGRSW